MERKIKQSLSISWKEGIPASMMLGVLDYYLVPYGLFLGATNRVVALLSALPHLAASVAQFWAMAAVRRAGSRLRVVVVTAAAQAAVLLPMAALALADFRGRLAALVALAVAFRVLNNLCGTAWSSLVSEYLPAQRRGGYFGWRARIAGLAALAGTMMGGLLLAGMKPVSLAAGFFILFAAAALLRFLSAGMLSRMAELPLTSSPGSDFTFLMFLRRFRESNFVKFVLFVASTLFTTHLAAPYFSVYMLRDLGLGYFLYMVIHLAAAVGSLAAFPIWGRNADVVGNARILKTTGWLIPVIPLLWLISRDPAYLMLVEFFAGFVWGGFNLCAANFIYDAVTPEKRVRCLGYFNLISGVAIFAGALIGGFLADRLPPLLGLPLMSLFLLSGLLRFTAMLWPWGRFKEVRESARKVSSRQLFFSVVGIRPLAGEALE
ncbi:MAG: MFS transporter [Candidatus Omnitrophota bacterium]|nr:MFS transporter [Candidatus Omnitrophota bacterium]